MSRFPRYSRHATTLLVIAWTAGLVAVLWHLVVLRNMILLPDGITLSLGNTASFIGLLLALTALIMWVIESGIIQLRPA